MWLRSEKTPINQHGRNEKFLRDEERGVGGSRSRKIQKLGGDRFHWFRKCELGNLVMTVEKLLPTKLIDFS